MADWFKFFNDTLDDPKFQYAISEHSEVTSVFLLILSEASKKRSATIPWQDQDFELFGYSRKINVTVPILNQCMNLLVKIGYIEKGSGCINVLSWNKMQSDYCKGLMRNYGQTTKSVATNSEVCPVRGEEIRGYKIKKEDRNGFSGAAAVIKNQELGRAMERLTVITSQYEAHQNWSEPDLKEKKILKDRIKTLKAELGVVV